MFVVYAIQSMRTNQVYVGQTENIEKRLHYHNAGYVKSTCNRRPWVILAFEKCESRDKARWIERELKKSKGKRLKWIERNLI